MPPSPPTRKTSHLERKVDDLVRKYTEIPEPRPVLRHVLHRPEQSALLIDAVGRQVSLIRCRSRAFDDGQVTVYDRALLVLSKDGKDLVDTGALELYLTEFLGLVPICGASNVEDAMAKHVGLQSGLNQLSKLDSGNATKTSSSDITRYHRDPPSPRRRHDHDHHRDERKLRASPSNDIKTFHSRLERILDIYYRAKHDYQRTQRSEDDDAEILSSIRFLRDTAENTILYLRTNKLFDHELIPELEDTFRWSRDRAAELFGGRKRHFDDDLGHGHRRGGSREKREKRERREKRVIDSYRP